MKKQEILKKHIDFWNLEDVKKPIIQNIGIPDWKPKPYPIKNGNKIRKPQIINPNEIDIDSLLGFKNNSKKDSKVFNGEKINALGCIYPEAWMEALIGCPIYASAVSCTSKPNDKDPETFTIEKALNSDWFKIMEKVLSRAVEVAEDKIAVRQLHLRGIIDMLAAYFGEEKLCLYLYDFLKKIDDLAEKFIKIYIKTIKNGLKIRPEWNGGYVSVWGLYAPGELVDYQIDASSLFSPKMYEEFFLNNDKKIIKQFPYSIIHLHACGLHMLDVILEIEELKAVQIQLDRETGEWDKINILERCKKVQKKSKSLLICGELSNKELKEFMNELDAKGLAIFYWN